uniref:Zinc finger protein 366 n=1 Tax=Nothobranchius furzeri TaxID=105023 RepID=A0A8C6LRU8_NOTFU
MDKDAVNFPPGGSPSFRDEPTQTPQRGFFLSPVPLYIKPQRFPPPSYPSIAPTAGAYGAFSPPAFFRTPGFGYGQKEESRRRKRAPLETDGGESADGEEEAEDSSSSKGTLDLHVPIALPPRSISSPSSKPIPGMIELNRPHHRSLALNLPVQVKQESLSPSPVWPPSPLFLHPPYFPPVPHSRFPYPFLLPGPVMHLPPGGFYPRQDRRLGQPARDDAPRSGTTNPEKLGLNVHVDDSYYVDVGGDQKRWKCRMCEKSYTSKYNLVTHILGHNGIKPHGCHLCGKLFKQLSHLHTHLLTHQGMRPHKCQVCHKAFTQTSHLKRHMMQHSDVKPYSCSVCGRGFAYPSELRAHELKHEKGQENVCVECGLDFPTLAQLKRHLTVHRGPAFFICFLQILSWHLRALFHVGVKEHKCRICGREFTLLICTNKKLPCNVHLVFQLCGKEFNRMHNLMGHMHLHSDSKPFKCLYCPSKFTLKGNLTRHMKVKHGVKLSHLLSHFGQEEPFDLSQKDSSLQGLRLSQSDGESLPGSSCQEEDEESLYRRSQYSPEVDQQEPGGEGRYIPETEEQGQGGPGKRTPGKTPKRQKYQQSSEDEAFEGGTTAKRRAGALRRHPKDTSESETSFESYADEQEYRLEKVGGSSFTYESVSEDEELDEHEQSRQADELERDR